MRFRCKATVEATFGNRELTKVKGAWKAVNAAADALEGPEPSNYGEARQMLERIQRAMIVAVGSDRVRQLVDEHDAECRAVNAEWDSCKRET